MCNSYEFNRQTLAITHKATKMNKKEQHLPNSSNTLSIEEVDYVTC